MLVDKGLFESRAKACEAIEAGCVFADGARVVRPSQRVRVDADITSTPAHPYVSRGGLKLVAALDAFAIDPRGLTCLDVGASTGGFCDVLLRRGAALVYAVDVGRDQLHERIRKDDRVVSLEQTDARSLTRDVVAQSPDLITCDASFISLEKILPTALGLAGDRATLVALFKPPFEVGPAHVGKGGRVTDDAAVRRALERVTVWLAGEGWPVRAAIDSPIRGGDGNREMLLWTERAQ